MMDKVEQKQEHVCSVIIESIHKSQNIGAIIRSASAFGVKHVVLIGKHKTDKQVKFTAKNFARVPWNHATAQQLNSHYVDVGLSFARYDTLVECVQAMKKDGYTIFGIEIGEKSQSVIEHPFATKSAFIFGSEDHGMSAASMELCDKLVFVPQHSAIAASLNVSVAVSIVLHHFAVWAALPTAPVLGSKFISTSTEVVTKKRKLDKVTSTLNSDSISSSFALSSPNSSVSTFVKDSLDGE